MSDPKADYIAAHNRAAQGGDSMSAAMDILNGGDGGGPPPAEMPTPQPGQPPAAAPPAAGTPPPAAGELPATGWVPPPIAPPPPPKPMPPSDLPYGKQLLDLARSYGTRVYNWASPAYVPPEKRENFWKALTEGGAGIPAEVGHQFVDSISRLPEDIFPWTHLQGNITDLQRIGPNAANDVLGAVLSPLFGLLKSGVARPWESLTGVNRELESNILGAVILHRAMGSLDHIMRIKGIPKPPELPPPGGPPPPPPGGGDVYPAGPRPPAPTPFEPPPRGGEPPEDGTPPRGDTSLQAREMRAVAAVNEERYGPGRGVRDVPAGGISLSPDEYLATGMGAHGQFVGDQPVILADGNIGLGGDPGRSNIGDRAQSPRAQQHIVMEYGSDQGETRWMHLTIGDGQQVTEAQWQTIDRLMQERPTQVSVHIGGPDGYRIEDFGGGTNVDDLRSFVADENAGDHYRYTGEGGQTEALTRRGGAAAPISGLPALRGSDQFFSTKFLGRYVVEPPDYQRAMTAEDLPQGMAMPPTETRSGVTLQPERVEAPGRYYPQGSTYFQLGIMKNGGRIGSIVAHYDPLTRDIYVSSMGTQAGPQGMGMRAVADMLRSLQTMFPDARTITGYRVSGARGAGLGAQEETLHFPEIQYRDHATTERLRELDAKMMTPEGLTPAERAEYEDITHQRAADLGPIRTGSAERIPRQFTGEQAPPPSGEGDPLDFPSEEEPPVGGGPDLQPLSAAFPERGATQIPTQAEAPFTIGPENRVATDRPMNASERAEFEAFARGDETASPVNVALRGLSNPDTAVQTIHDLAQILPRRGVMSIDEMEMRARSLGLSIDEVGEAARLRDLGPIQTALQAALLSAGRQVGESAVRWRESAGDQRLMAAAEADAMRVMRFMEIWDTSGTEMGRGQRARQEGAQQFSEFDQQLRAIFENNRHAPFEEVVNRIADLVRDTEKNAAAAGTRSARFLNWIMRWTGADAIKTAFYNILLSNPAILGKKIVSDQSMAAAHVATTFWAEKLGRGDARFPPGTTAAVIRGYREALPSATDLKNTVVGAAEIARNYLKERTGGAAEGSTRDMIHGYYAALPEMFRLSAKALKAGGGNLWGDYLSLRQGVETSRDRLSQLANGMPLDEDSNALEQAGSWWRAMLPTSWIGSIDDAAKFAHYRAALHGWAWREAAERIAQREAAAARGAPQGNAPSMTHEELYQSLVDNPTDKGHHWASTQAQDWALQRDPGGWTGSVGKAIDNAMLPLRLGPYRTEIPVGRVIVPFTKIVLNSMRFAYRYSPASFIFESPAWKEDMRAGGAQKALALASRGLGTAAMGAMAPVLAGFIPGIKITGHGPTGFAQRRQWIADGNEPYMLYVGDRAIPYGNVEFLASWLGPMADARDLMASTNREDDGLGVAQSLILGVGQTITNKSMMEGLSDFMEALQHPDTRGKRYFYNLGASALPFSSGGAFALRRGIDPYMRMHNDFASTVASRTPGFSEGLPPVVTTWGDPVKYQGNFMGRMGWPLDVHEKPYVQPVDHFMAEHKQDWTDMDPNHIGFSPPGNTLSVSAFERGHKMPWDLKEPQIQIPLTLQEEHDYKVLAGQGVTYDANHQSLFKQFGGRTLISAKDGFNALVEHRFPDARVQQVFDNYSPREQVQMLVNVWGNYRKAAHDQFVARPEIAAIIKSARAARADQLKGNAANDQGGSSLFSVFR